MKLELKHLLSYGESLTIIWEGVYCKVEGYDFINNSVILERVLVSMEDVKLLLRPLSDLTKEIEHNGEKFVPVEIFDKVIDGWCDAYNEWWNLQYPNFLQMMDSCPYEVMQQLLEWHFDVFGLIDQNLAIDINTINK